MPFPRGADFPVAKPAATPCRNLLADHRCRIHDRLLDEGWKGCVTFDCFGAGQRVVQLTFGGRTWRDDPEVADEQFSVFLRMRELHEILALLVEAERLVSVGDGGGGVAGADALAIDEVRSLTATIDALAGGSPGEVLAVDVAELRRTVGPLLAAVAAQARQSGPTSSELATARAATDEHRRTGRSTPRRAAAPPALEPYADLAGRDLRGVDLRRRDLRGALLIGADLRGTSLDRTMLLGADLRDADVRGAQLAEALFLTGPQLAAARGDAATTVPDHLARPGHWTVRHQ
nr:pentapeptide repeat-containing protein [Arsenicicoccus piscis]